MSSRKDRATRNKPLSTDSSESPSAAHPFLILLAGFASAFLLLFCCLCAGTTWWFQPEVQQNSEQAEKLLEEIVQIQVPDSYHAHGTVEWNLAYLMTIRGVYFERFAGDGLLTIVEVNSRFRSEDDVQRHIRETLLRMGGGGTPLIIDDQETTVVEILIDEVFVPFKFEIGRDPPSGRVFRIVEGVFNGKHGEVLLSMRVNNENWNEESVMTMLNSIGRDPATLNEAPATREAPVPEKTEETSPSPPTADPAALDQSL